jgi:hypothetical protein
LRKSIRIASWQNLFPVIAQAQPIVGVIYAIVSLIPNQNHTRPSMNVTVICHVNQQFLTDLILNPIVKNGD